MVKMSANMEYPNIADGDSVAHGVQIDLHMLRPLVMDGVGGEIHGADVYVTRIRIRVSDTIRIGYADTHFLKKKTPIRGYV